MAVPAALQPELEKFLALLLRLPLPGLRSVLLIGSAARDTYNPAASDVNLLVIYDELDGAALQVLAPLAREWFRKRRFAPRFLTLDNLTRATRYFQLDWWDMKEAHEVLYGEDVLQRIEFSRADLHWQLAHEIKRMRMRVKQEFWRSSDDPVLLQRVLANRERALGHLLRALRFLEDAAEPEPAPPPAQDFASLLDRIRSIDDRVDRLAV